MKRMKKAISLLAAAVLVFALAVPVNASSVTDVQDAPAAVVTEVSDAEELATAIANGGNIQLTGDIKLEEGLTVASDKTVVLDLNGYTISHEKAQTTAYAMIENKGDLTITDSSENQTGVIRYADITSYTADNNHASNTIKNEAVLTIEGGTIENVSSDNVASYGYPHAIDVYQGSTTNISGGTVKSVNYDSIRMFCNSTTEATILNITEGTIINRISFQVPSASAANGVLNISGGNFITTDNVSANVRLLAFGTDLSNMKATISGGTFDKCVAISNYSNGEISWTPVTGGTFAKDVSAYVAEGYDCDKQSDGIYVVGLPLKDIIDSAEDGSTITLDRDYTVNDTIYINKNLTVDGNGHMITTDVQKPFRINADADGNAPVTEAINVTFQNISMTSDVDQGRLIETRGGFVDLTLDNVSLTTTGTNSQPYTAGGNHEDSISVTIKDSTIDAGTSGYGIITFNPVKMDVSNSTIGGFSAFYFKGVNSSAGSAGSEILIKGSSIAESKNIHSGESNSFATFVFADDDITVNVENSKVFATATGDQPQLAFGLNNGTYSVANVINVYGGSNIQVDEADEVVTDSEYMTLVIKDATSNVDVSDYVAEGYNCTQQKDGSYLSCNHFDTEGESAISIIDQKDATCTEAGYAGTSVCSLCNYTVQGETIESAGHKVTHYEAVASTCTEDGNVEYWNCSVCKKNFADENGETVLETVVDAKDGHDLEEHAAVAATCTKEGSIKYWSCKNCEVNFADAEGKTVLEGTTIVGTIAHKTELQNVKEATCTEAGYTGDEVCTECEQTITSGSIIDKKAHTEVVDEAVAPTCQKTGLTEGSHCGVCGEVLVAQKEVAKVEHKYSAYAYNDDATCTEDGTETAVCDFGCGAESTLVAEGTALGHTEVIDEVVVPTCQKTGLTEGKHCSVCDEVLVAQEVVPVVEHKYTTYAYNNDATCTKDGTETAKCDFGCGAVSTLTKEGSALGHTEVIDKGVAATCTATGITEGKHCSVCDEVLVAQKELPALGHDYVKGVCTRCNSIIEVVGDTTQSVTKEEVTTDKKEDVVVKEVTIIEDTNTEAAKEIVKTEANTIVADIVTEVVVAEKPVEELQIVKDEVISVETAQKVIKAIEEGKTDFETEIVVEAAAPELIEKAVAQNIEKKAETTLGADAKVAQYLDVSVLLKCAETGDTLGTIDKLDEEIVVTIAIPENLKADGRTYIIIREHNGVIENIPTVVNKDGTISFKTGKFSTYALAYTDTGVSAPKTGDMPMAAPIAGICVAGIVLAAAMARRKSIAR